MYLCKFDRERPIGSENRAQKRLNIHFFKDDDLENEVILKVKPRSPKISTLHFATMKEYIKFSWNTLFNSRYHTKPIFWSKFDISKCWYDLENKVRATKI